MDHPGISGWAAAVLMILLGLLRSTGGAFLLVKKNLADPQISASPGAAVYCGIGLIVIGIAELVSAWGIITGKRSFLYLGILFTLIFVADGMINGYVLYGSPMEKGTIMNITAAALIISLIFFRLYRG